MKQLGNRRREVSEDTVISTTTAIPTNRARVIVQIVSDKQIQESVTVKVDERCGRRALRIP